MSGPILPFRSFRQCPRCCIEWLSTYLVRWFLYLDNSTAKEVYLLASSHTTRCQHYYTLETALPPGALGIECLQPSLDISAKFCVSSSCISSSSSVQVPGRTCQRSAQTFDSDGTMMDGGSLASHISQHVDRCS